MVLKLDLVQIFLFLAIKLLHWVMMSSLKKSQTLKVGGESAVAYLLEEYVAVLKLMLSEPNALNAGKSLMKWRTLT
jgi:hypothetical protein